MASLPEEFDEGEDDLRRPLLPPEDRLWRHPSELHADEELGLDQSAVRSRWLASQPSRASTWTAGFVGALLATGLVVVGSHLASVLATPPSNGRAAEEPTLTTALPQLGAPVLGAALAASVRRIGQSVAEIDAAAASGMTEGRCLGVIIGSDGTVLTAAADVAHAASVLVYLPGDDVGLVGHVVGVDAGSGLAVLHVDEDRDLPVATFAKDTPAPAAFTVAVTTPGNALAAPAVTVGAIKATNVDGATPLGHLVDADLTDLSAATSPPGSPLLDPAGRVEGVVVGSSHGDAVVAPAWMAATVANELLRDGVVEHGWMGISGIDATALGNEPPGVRVVDVAAHGAAAQAGIRAGDEIVALDGSPVRSMNALAGSLYVLGAGTRVEVEYLHGGREHEATVVLGATRS